MEETKGEQINSPFKKDLILREELAIQPGHSLLNL